MPLRDGALGLGASKMPMILHHVLPQAHPGKLSSLWQKPGWRGLLLMIGMAAFIIDTPSSLTDSASIFPVQIFLWSYGSELVVVVSTQPSH